MNSDCMTKIWLSIIIPALNEAAIIDSTLGALEKIKSEQIEIIVVDGGSSDRTVEIARRSADTVLIKPGGRAIQMNFGASQANGTYLLFLHADTVVPPGTIGILQQSSRRNCIWGRFDIRLSGQCRIFRVVEYCMNLRSRLSGIATGDQGIFVERTTFRTMDGYPEIPLMEDIALSRKLKKISQPVCLTQKLTTSSRRWEERGIIRTILLMWWLRFRYFLGADPDKLASWYR
jgi:rSAM/selenodomain-associated transferase 2